MSTPAVGRRLEAFSRRVTRAAGSSWAFAVALAVIVVWVLTGPIFHFSDTWQLVVNTGTTIVTFLMVFLIQRAQNKDALALQLKLNEIVAALEGASNRLIDVEDLSEDELETLRQHYAALVLKSKKDLRLTQSHSVEEAEVRHRRKSRGARSKP
jgi:low affinity Fe/Cu permease